MGKKMRVDKLLSNVGVASRAELKKYCKLYFQYKNHIMNFLLKTTLCIH